MNRVIFDFSSQNTEEPGIPSSNKVETSLMECPLPTPGTRRFNFPLVSSDWSKRGYE